MHDFNFYKLKVSKVRWIGGFGDIAWLNEKHWVDEKPKWIKNEPDFYIWVNTLPVVHGLMV